MVELKSRILGGAKDSFSLTDFKVVLDLAQDLIERNYFNDVTYDAYQDTLEKVTVPIMSLAQLDLPKKYDVFTVKRIADLHKDFQEIAVKYRYYRAPLDGVPFYGDEYIRNRSGFSELVLLKWLVNNLLNGYGHQNTSGAKQLSTAEFQTFLFDMKPILEEFNLWSIHPEHFARNVVLLADLFQNSSNGDFEVNSNELTEFAQMLLAAQEITNNFQTDLTAVCDGGLNPKDPIFEADCFNKNFFDIFLKRYAKYFPRLAAYADPAITPPGELIDFLVGVEGFARDSTDTTLPIHYRDSVLTIGALLNIESTLLRFDTNHDNILDFDELVEANKVYSPAIISLAKLKPGDEKFAKSIFLYMVSKMEIPPTGTWLKDAKFFSFHECVSHKVCRNLFIKKIKGKRLNIGKLLFYLVKEAA